MSEPGGLTPLATHINMRRNLIYSATIIQKYLHEVNVCLDACRKKDEKKDETKWGFQEDKYTQNVLMS